MATKTCSHLDRIQPVTARTEGCEECLASGDPWVELRMCLTCGHVGCCDSSRNQHATKHFHDTGHPVMQSAEPTEDWAWCYPHADFVDPDALTGSLEALEEAHP